MKKLFSLIAFCSLLFSTDSIAQKTLIPFGSNWVVYDQGDQPANIGGLNWTDDGYNEGSWYEGRGQIGWGDNDECTEVNNSVTTMYVRHTFEVPDPDLFVNDLDLELLIAR